MVNEKASEAKTNHKAEKVSRKTVASSEDGQCAYLTFNLDGRRFDSTYQTGEGRREHLLR